MIRPLFAAICTRQISMVCTRQKSRMEKWNPQEMEKNTKTALGLRKIDEHLSKLHGNKIFAEMLEEQIHDIRAEGKRRRRRAEEKRKNRDCEKSLKDNGTTFLLQLQAKPPFLLPTARQKARLWASFRTFPTTRNPALIGRAIKVSVFIGV